MKKKFKLLTSIASLGLALAVMAFGVLAAATHTLSVTNTVGFDVGDHIAFEISGAMSSTGELMVDEDTDEPVASPVYANKKVTNNDTSLEAWTAGAAYILEVGDTITWTFTVKNVGSNDIVVSLLSNTVDTTYWGAENTNWKLEATDLTIAKGTAEAKNFTVVFTLLKAPQDVNGEGAVNFVVQIDNPNA